MTLKEEMKSWSDDRLRSELNRLAGLLVSWMVPIIPGSAEESEITEKIGWIHEEMTRRRPTAGPTSSQARATLSQMSDQELINYRAQVLNARATEHVRISLQLATDRLDEIDREIAARRARQTEMLSRQPEGDIFPFTGGLQRKGL